MSFLVLTRHTPEERVQQLCRRLDGDHEDFLNIKIDNGANNKHLTMIATSVCNSKSLERLHLEFCSDFAKRITSEQVDVLGSMIVGSTTLKTLTCHIFFHKIKMKVNALWARLSECHATDINICLLYTSPSPRD